MYATVYASWSDVSVIFMMSVSYEACSQCRVLEQFSVGALFFWDLLFKASRLWLFLLCLLTARDAAWQQQTAWRRSQSQNHPWQISLLILPVPASLSSNFPSSSLNLAHWFFFFFFFLAFIYPWEGFFRWACKLCFKQRTVSHSNSCTFFMASFGFIRPSVDFQWFHWRNQVFFGDVKHPVASYWTGGNNDS